MFYFIVAGLLAIAFLVALIGYVTTRHHKSSNRVGPLPAVGVVALFLVTTVIFSFTSVDARAVGISTTFGKYSDTLDSGAQFTAPWASVEEFTTRLQLADLDGEEGVPVTFNGGGSGKVNSTFQWGINPDDSTNGAKALWEKYRDFDEVQKFVLRAGRDAILNVANDYTPNDARTKQDVIASQVKTNLTETLKKYGIILDSVSILSMPLDARTQASLDKIVAAQNDVERAMADKQRAIIDNETAELRAKSGALKPEANMRYCLDIVNAWDAKNGPLPATFNCGLGGPAAGVLVK